MLYPVKKTVLSKYIVLVSVLAALTLLPERAHAQYPFGNDPYGNDPFGNQTFGMQGFDDFDEEGPHPRDSSERKIRKPLESYFFDDSTRVREIFVWHVDTYRNAVHPAGVDTAISGLQIDYPFLRKGVGDAYQGNMGGASLPLSYFDRKQYRDFSFAQAFDAYYFFPENARFFNVKKAFSQFSYYTAGQTRKREEGFGITHAQNISPSSGFNIDYKSRGTRGTYDWGKGRAKNLSMAFSHTGKKYSIHAGYIYNTINNKENGGITDHAFVTDTLIELPSSIPVHLNDARNVIKSNTYYLVQSYGVPLRKLTEDDFSIADQSSIFFGHSFVYSRWNKLYTDTYAASVYDKYEFDENGNMFQDQFYQNWYVDPLQTRDSLFQSKLSNRVFVQIQPWDRDGVIGLIDAGVGMDVQRYYQFRPNHYLSGRTKPVNKTDYYIYGGIQGKFRRYLDWGADIDFYPVGPRSGDLRIGAQASVSAYIKGRPITLSGKFFNDLRSPDYWTKNYFSNHFVWKNSFSRENETRIELAFTVPSWAMELGASQSMVNDKIYFDQDAMPAQHSGSVSVSGLYAQKDFRIGGFHFNPRVLLQWSTSEEVVPVPLASAYVSLYYEFDVVKNVLRAQFGIDGRYHTRYYAPGYMPATAQFYNQREREIGNYPYFDVFLTGKWKRMRILLKMEHLNEDLFGRREYFTLLNYPLNTRVFKMGFSWSFYD